MPFPIPSLEDTRQQVSGDIEAYLPGTQARTRRSTLGVLAFAQAGAVHGLYAYIDNRWRNFLPDDKADAEGVERWARRYKLWYREPQSAGGSIKVLGTPGTTLAAGSMYQNSEGAVYSTRNALTLTGTDDLVSVDAQTPGPDSNLPAGTRVTLINPVSGIQSSAIVAEGGLSGGATEENLDGLRDRVHRRMSAPPQGGSLTDYETWALESHPAITRAWATEHEQGSGSVVVRIVCDNQDTPIPNDEVLGLCTNYIAQRRPAGRRSVYILPPVAAPVTYRIRAVPNSPQVRAAIESELRDLHRRESAPGATLLLSHIREAVSIATGETDNSVLEPLTDLVFGIGEMPVFGDITWV